ncbi:hypothetical protein CTAYLR_001592 [Chrysophaeum taylorii]|uniref:Non-canonical E2 ubiquitin-conjugating enzyme C-terminal domain-containing protein n=1 Tax=Chrysophaeum taylorii TaxID=2483200 RepID=A0AAD7XLV1_9STRA|nr:hypothetical protein CTAYLR_001592 [Chrysophaeum taylorii]
MLPVEDEEEEEEEEEVAEEVVMEEATRCEVYALSATATRLTAAMREHGERGEPRVVASIIIRELVANGIRALDARFFGGKKRPRGLAIRARKFEDANGRAWISVADSGCGMTRGDLINRLASPGANRADRGDEPAWTEALRAGDVDRLFEELGAGVFSAFAAGDALRVVTRNVDDTTYRFDLADGKSMIRELVEGDDDDDVAFAGGLVVSGSFPSRRGTVVSFRLRPAWQDRFDDASLRESVSAVAETSHYKISVGDDDDDDDDDAAPEEDESEAEDPMVVDDDEGERPSTEDHIENHHHRKSYAERAKFVPLRLSYGERKVLRLVEAAVKVSGYVDRVDNETVRKKPARRKQLQLQGIAGILTGLIVSVDYEEGQRTATDNDASQHAKFLQRCFEIARRYKILNPEKMRSEYGQLVYLLQDASIDEIRDALGVDLVAPVKTVYGLLKERGGLRLLDDPLVRDAASEVLPDPTKSRAQIQHMIRRKDHAVKVLGRRYASDRLSVDDVELCLCSICDNESYLNSNRLPIDQTLAMLREHFDPDDAASADSLAIEHGDSGARLSHSHARQYRFAEQSLSLWRAVVDDMFRLWHLAEADLLSGDAPYDLRDTGQGLQRVQSSPRTYSAMLSILKDEREDATKTTTTTTAVAAAAARKWIGSSMVHMADHNVPNALTFLDKYAQVARILRPLVTVLARAIRLCDDDIHVKALVDRMFGSPERFRIAVLADFFRHAFDGSGADNFYDAGSCVDGRLTSAWNWCQQVVDKRYYIIFKLAGFNGFDGEFD